MPKSTVGPFGRAQKNIPLCDDEKGIVLMPLEWGHWGDHKSGAGHWGDPSGVTGSQSGEVGSQSGEGLDSNRWKGRGRRGQHWRSGCRHLLAEWRSFLAPERLCPVAGWAMHARPHRCIARQLCMVVIVGALCCVLIPQDGHLVDAMVSASQSHRHPRQYRHSHQEQQQEFPRGRPVNRSRRDKPRRQPKRPSQTAEQTQEQKEEEQRWKQKQEELAWKQKQEELTQEQKEEVDRSRSEFLLHHMHVARTYLQEDPTNPCPGKAREEGTPLTVFLVLFKGRSGSSAFMSELAQHDEILVPGYEPWELATQAFPHSDLIPNAQIQINYMDDAIAVANKHNCRAMGFKFRPTVESVAIVRQHRARWGVRVVVQDRWNIVARAVSGYRHQTLANPTQFDRARDGANVTDSRVTINNWDEFELCLRKARQESNALRMKGAMLQAEKIYYYEQYVLDHARTMRSIFNLLGVDPEQHDPSFSADTNSISLCDRVANFQDLCAQYWCRPKDVDYHLLQDPWQDCTCSPVPKCTRVAQPNVDG